MPVLALLFFMFGILYSALNFFLPAESPFRLLPTDTPIVMYLIFMSICGVGAAVTVNWRECKRQLRDLRQH